MTPLLTATLAPSVTPTLTASPRPTEAPSATHTATATETQTGEVTEEPTAEQTAEASPTEVPGGEATVEVTAEVETTDTATETQVTVETATTASPAATVDVSTPVTPPTPTAEPLPPEPPLTLIFTENFDGGPSMLWTLGQGWSYVAHDNGLALQGMVSGEAVTFANGDVLDAAVEMQFQLQAGTAQLSTRVSEAGAYAVQVAASGEVRLLRGDDVLRTATMAAIDPDTWHTLRLATFGDIVWVTLDGTVVMTVRDPQPLPAGTVTIAGQGIKDGSMDVDLFVLLIRAETSTSVQPTATPSSRPTATMTPTPSADDIGFMALSNGDVLYRFAPDLASLESAINEANGNPFDRYVIFLNAPPAPSGTPYYDINKPGFGTIYFILGDIIMVGADEINPPVIRNVGDPRRLFQPQPGSRLLLRNLIIEDFGGTSNVGVGGVAHNRGQLLVYEVTFQNNVGDLSGGALDNQGDLNIWNSHFDGNSAPFDGGAINNGSGSTQIQCTTFSNNRANFGGAIANVTVVGGTVIVNNSNFQSNDQNFDASGGTLAVWNNVDSAQPSIDARYNWWNSAGGPTAPGFNGGGEPISENITYDNWATSSITITDPVVCPEPPEAVIPPESLPTPTPTSTPTLTPTPTANFKIQIVDTSGLAWSQNERMAVDAAVSRTANALQIVSQQGGNPEAVFNRVMVDGDTLESIMFVRGSSTTDSDANGVVDIQVPHPVTGLPMTMDVNFGNCKTIQGTGDNNPDPAQSTPRIIVCNGNTLTITEFVLVHEMGHIFDNRSTLPTDTRGQLFRYVEQTSTQACIDFSVVPPQPICVLDANDDIVMGNLDDGSWARGERGWGSGPASQVTDFQQHPIGLFQNEDSIDETGADMFLNWVYRLTNPNPQPLFTVHPGTWDGFRNTSWRGSACQSAIGCDDDTYPGDYRFGWMTTRMNTIFMNESW